MIDTKLIAAHQWIIDTTEKKPTWWAEQVAYSHVIAGVIPKVLLWKSGWDAVMLLLVLCVGGFMIFAARHEPVFKRFADAGWVRGLFVAFVFMNLVTLIVSPSGIAVLNLAATILMLSYYYFACCENPRPKKRKEKLVLKTASQ